MSITMEDVPAPPPPRKADKPEMAKLNVLVPNHLREAVKNYAVAHDSTLTAAVVQALQEYSERRHIPTDPDRR